jgi:NAD+ kinase
VVTHGKPELIGDAVARLEEAARVAEVELVESEQADPDVAIVLGGDGTMLRALRAYLGTSVPVFGVNFGRVGFLTSVGGDRLEDGVLRVFRGEYRVVELSTLRVDFAGESHPTINDLVVTSSRPGRIVELGWRLDEEDLGSQACDGLICSTPTGSTAYNLSNGGPVMMWGIDAMAMTFVAPHSLHARPLVVPRGPVLRVTNATLDVPVTVIVDGHGVGELASDQFIEARMGELTGLLATLPDVTFFARYHQVFP